MGILSKKVYRDLRYSKGRSLSIILIVAIATGLYGGLFLAYENIVETFEGAEEEANIESVRFTMNFTDPSKINLGGINAIEDWDYRLNIITSLELLESDKTFTAVIFGVPADHEPRVNNILIDDDDGEYFKDNQSRSILLIEQFMIAQKLDVGDKVSLYTPDGLQEVSISAAVYSPEYVYNINPKSGLPDVTGLAAGWMPLTYAQELYQLENQINEVVVRFKPNVIADEELFDAAIAEVETRLKTVASQIAYTKLNDEAEQKMKDADVGALDDMARVFGLVILLLALFAIYDNISKLIASQRNYIGTMRALGGSKRVVTLHYTSMGSILGAIGVFLGIPFGWLISYAMTVEYAHLLGIPEPSTKFMFPPFIEAIAIILGLSVFLSFISSLSAARIRPLEAMSSSFVTIIYSAKPILERFFTKIPGLKSASSAIPIRGLFRHKKRTLITIFTYSMSLVLIIAALGFMDSFTQALDDNYEKNEMYDLQVFYYPDRAIDPIEVTAILGTIDGIEDHEGFVSSIVEISKGENRLSVPLYGYHQDSDLRHLDLSGGSFSGLVLGINLANNLDADYGEQVQLMDETYSVNGIVSEVIADGAYLPIEQAQSMFNLEGNITGTILTISDGFDEKSIKDDLLASELPISLILSTSEVKSSIETLIQGLMALIGIMVFIGFITVALFSFNTVVLDVMTRRNEFINLRSLGSSRKKITKVIALQGMLISVVGSIVAIPLSYYITDWIIKEMIQDLMVLPTDIYPQSYAVGIIAAFLASLVGVWSAVRYVMSIDMVDALRTRVSN
jgi:putative ABC transport system permease protein